MSLSAGTRIGPYEVQAPLGAGGMGEVYRARDTKLARDVALKILPAEFALDADRVARFTREAQMLAALNHQNIAGIYGLEDGPAEAGHYSHALVLEFVDGPTLADRIAQGPLSIDDALPIARQIAEALEAAHEQGIIHRDLKPANIKVRPDGMVKVLDFGLAKLAQASGPRPQTSVAGLTVAATITTPAITQVGVMLGTAAYMSPEQAKGREADKRSDLWAFGCVLFEMLTGTRTFPGDDVSDTLAAVLRADPDWIALPSSTPRAIRTLLRRCLEKDRKRRLADAADARLEIEEALAAPAREPVGVEPAPGRRPWRTISVASSALIVGGLMVGLAMWSRQPAPPARDITRFTIALGDGRRFFESGNPVLAISPDGSRIVYSADRRLYLRSLSELEARPIAGTETPVGQVSAPVFSPDGQSIAFVSGRPASIKRISVTGGAAVTICEGCGSLGTMNWGRDGIVFAQAGQGMPPGFAGERARQGVNRIMRVAADGGEPQLLFNVTDGTPWDVQLLPDGQTVLFGLVKNMIDIAQGRDVGAAEGEIVVQSPTTGERKIVIANGSAPLYLPTGHLVYARQGFLFARRFDYTRVEAVGEEVPIVTGVRRAEFIGGSTSQAYFDVSPTGTLVFVPGSASRSLQYDLGVLDPQKGVELLKLPPNSYRFPRVSPDGRLVAVATNDGRSENIWIYERSSHAIRQLTSTARNRYPIWSPDSASVTFQSDREGDNGMFRQPANGSGTAERLTRADAGTSHVPDSWSPDGKTLLFEMLEEKKADRNLWAFSLNDKRTALVGSFRGGTVSFIQAAFSPNGRWFAYRSLAEGVPAVSVQAFPATGAIFPIYENALHPVWSRDGKTLFFSRMTTGELMATPVVTESAFSFGTPRQLPVTFPDRESNSAPRNHDVTPDGKFIGLVAVRPGETEERSQINVVLNWFEELKQKLPR
jgi:eukaryotic-like serine/threonine-protein kinase